MVFSSVYEMFNPLTTVSKQRKWWWFSGNTSGTITSGTTTDIYDGWSITDNQSGAGGHSFDMDDVVDGGMKVTTASDDLDTFTLNPSNNHAINWVGFDSMAWIAVAKLFETTELDVELGLKDDTSTATKRGLCAFEVNTDTSNNWFFSSTNNAQAGDKTDTSTAIDTNFHSFKGESNGTSSIGTIDGVVVATNTGTQPDQKKNFNFRMRNLSASSRSVAIRYCEVYNT
jgi:hypothetical protein